MAVVINYKICDLAPECGGIEVCPMKAFFWNEKTKKPDVDNSKCISCGACSLQCPVNAIMVAKTDEQYKKLVEIVKNDTHTEEELWRERLGCQPGRTKPLATIVTPENFSQEVTNAKGLFTVDIWSLETIDCRLHSVLWDDVNLSGEMVLKKIDAGKYPELAKKLNVKKIPSLLFFKDGKELKRHEGYIYQENVTAAKRLMQ